MKKRILAIILSCTMAIGCINVPATGKTDASSSVKTEDVSKCVLQEGGFPSKAYVGSPYKYSRKSAKNNNKNIRYAADLLMATWDSLKTECNLSKYHITYEELNNLVSSLQNKYPRYFYLISGGYVHCYINSNGYVSDVICDYKYDKAQIKRILSDYNTAIGKILEGVNPSWSDLEKALYFNDYLASHCEYDNTYSKYTAYDALVDNKAVCEGYSLAYVELLSRVGIPCKVVSSDSLNHAWNMVYINNHYYYVDVTWNDPLGNYSGRAGHRFFLKSEAFFRSEEGKHLVADDWDVDDDWNIHDANDSSYDNYFWNNMDTGFQYIDGFWYAFDGKETIKKYSYHNGNFDDIENIVTINDIWYDTSDNSGAFWVDKYVGTGKFGNAFYYSSSDKIYRLDIKTHESSLIYELSTEQKSSGNIWSIYIDPDGKLYYYYYRSGEIHLAEKELALQLEKITDDQINQITCYQIQFNGNGADSGDMKNINNCLYGQTYSLGKNAFTYKNYKFTGWNTKPDGTGVSYEDNADIQNLTEQNYGIVTLYAQWKPQKELSTSNTTTKRTKLSYTNLKLKKGSSAILRLLNNTQKVSWKIITGKKYITLKNKSNTKVTIKGIKKGTAKVQALVGNKKYICTVKVS